MDEVAIVTLSMKEKKVHPAFICKASDLELLLELLEMPAVKEKIRYLDCSKVSPDSVEAALRYSLKKGLFSGWLQC